MTGYFELLRCDDVTLIKEQQPGSMLLFLLCLIHTNVLTVDWSCEWLF